MSAASASIATIDQASSLLRFDADDTGESSNRIVPVDQEVWPKIRRKLHATIVDGDDPIADVCASNLLGVPVCVKT